MTLLDELQRTGRMPGVELTVTSLATGQTRRLDNFLSYGFQSSILIPVDSFQFTYANPQGVPVYEEVKDGDQVTLTANGVPVATGIIDTVEVHTSEAGEQVTLSGRDLLGQLEDNSAVDDKTDPIWGNSVSIGAAVKFLIANTRIPRYTLRNCPSIYRIFGTDPGENRLSALQRFCEPLNILFWSGGDGALIVGKPNMSPQNSKGLIVCNRTQNATNVLEIRSSHAATQIPNILVPVWAGQESTLTRVPKDQLLLNSALRPSQLRKARNFVTRAVVVSPPDASGPQGFDSLTSFQTARAGDSTILQGYAKRELARANKDELIVQCVVPGHYNENGDPYLVDQVYKVEYERGSVNEFMYLFDVNYSLDEQHAQSTRLTFCKLGTIVADINYKRGNNAGASYNPAGNVV